MQATAQADSGARLKVKALVVVANERKLITVTGDKSAASKPA